MEFACIYTAGNDREELYELLSAILGGNIYDRT